jgi:hypothetical protein
MMKMRRMMIYRIASIIEMTDKILKNEMKMIVWTLTSFLTDDRDFSTEMMMNHCMNFLIFLKILMREFSKLLIEMKMKMIVWGNFSLLMIHEMIVSLMLVEMIFLSLIDLEMMISELIADKILWIAYEILLIVMILNVLILIEMLVKSNLLNFVQNSFSTDE